MKKRIGVIILAICSVMVLGTALAQGDSQEAIVRDLITQRTDTLAGFYAGDIDQDAAIETIEYMETDLQKKMDIENIDKYFRTDIEQVKKYEFERIHVTFSDDEMICADVTIRWEAEGLMGKEDFSHTYEVICIKEDNRYKLAQFY